MFKKTSMEVRRRLAEAKVTLDGAAARIIGVRNEFATVATVDGARSCTWSWRGATAIVAAGGSFRS